ncbi:hypothetical protein HK097_011674 [Rhizophlyctis rosea]|uniref:Uncharacterized protein n=1 Tax=Rhizophlyctis rosea TaxID=64517 RepID=A0AAD5X8H1_9FUNG|nr:hypothetical protein HK097_011674 [Rhizophlyctis rosea]
MTNSTPKMVQKPLLLTVLASNRINWTRALLKHPLSENPRLHGLYDEHLERLKHVHKLRTKQCINEAFYQNLPRKELHRHAKALRDETFKFCDVNNRNATTWYTLDYLKRTNVNEHARTVVRAAVSNFMVLMFPGLAVVLPHMVADKVCEWQHKLASGGDCRGRVIERVAVRPHDNDQHHSSLILCLIFDNMKRQSLKGYIDAFSLLPLPVLDSIFGPERACAEVVRF